MPFKTDRNRKAFFAKMKRGLLRPKTRLGRYGGKEEDYIYSREPPKRIMGLSPRQRSLSTLGIESKEEYEQRIGRWRIGQELKEEQKKKLALKERELEEERKRDELRMARIGVRAGELELAQEKAERTRLPKLQKPRLERRKPIPGYGKVSDKRLSIPRQRMKIRLRNIRRKRLGRPKLARLKLRKPRL